jgi:hypothetical protein
MFRRELLTLAVVIFGVFAVAVGGAWYITHLYSQEVKRAATDTLPSLVNASAVAQRVGENWAMLQSVRESQSYSVRSNLIVQIRANAIKPYLDAYAQTTDPGQEQQLYDKLCSERDVFAKLRHKYFETILTNQMAEAERLYYDDLVTAHDHYETAAKNLYNYDVEDAGERVLRVSQLTRFMPWAAGGLGLALFLAGMAFGLKAALGGLGFVSRLLDFGKGMGGNRK